MDVYMSTLVYGSNITKAKKKVKSMLETIPAENVVRVNEGKYEIFVQLKNGDCIKGITPNALIRGYKYDRAYIDKTIPRKTVEEIILPSALPRARILYY